MALDITGTLVKILPAVNGNGANGSWTKQEFIIETQEQYPKKVCLEAWGDKVNELAKFGPGDTVTASINLESREYNEKWYTSIRAWKFESGVGKPQQAAAPVASQPAPSAVPTTPLPTNLAPITEEEEGDLPF